MTRWNKPLHRLTAADYSNGDYYHYTYDAAGNRLTQERSIAGLVTTDTYVYDDANRLTRVNDDVNYDWDGNGNLRNDGVNTYHYDAANRLILIDGPSADTTFAYNGLGDRLQETIGTETTTFTMDLNTGLTQALSDGTNTYVYGIDRIAQVNGPSREYFLGDALGSVRQLTDAGGAITYASAYDPYGVKTQTYGASQTAYGFTNEYMDSYIKLIYLRSRWYDPASGRLLTRDSWQGDYNRPLSLNRWMYVEGNPVNRTDPYGYCGVIVSKGDKNDLCWQALHRLENNYPFVDMQSEINVSANNYWTLDEVNHVAAELEKLDNAAAVDLLQELGGKVKFKRARTFSYCGLTIARVLPLTLYNNAFVDPACTGTVGHELAHMWDRNRLNNISKSFEKYIGAYTIDYFFVSGYNTGPERAPIYGVNLPPPNRKEDFAESLNEYVYDDPYTRIVPGESRWRFIEHLLSTGQFLSNGPVAIPVPEAPVSLTCTPIP